MAITEKDRWDGRKLCSLRLSDNYHASGATIEIMKVGITFAKGVSDERHPQAQSKKLALTFTEASQLSDGRFEVSVARDDAEKAKEAEKPRGNRNPRSNR